MSASKPIDWTRPLRVVGTHAQITRVLIVPGQPRGDFWVQSNFGSWAVNAHTGCGARDSHGLPIPGQSDVENIPPEPRIVEMWTAVYKASNGTGSRYWAKEDWLKGGRNLVYDSPPKITPAFPGGVFRIARVLIEEPGE